MFRVVLCWFILVVLIGGIYGVCDCKPKTAKEAFCNADWVSRVKILKKAVFDKMHCIYNVNHIRIFKLPPNAVNKTLPTDIATPDKKFDCGLPNLKIGIEYLMSGQYIKGTLTSDFCEQIGPDGVLSGLEPQIWSKVTKKQIFKLNKGKYLPCKMMSRKAKTFLEHLFV